MYCNVCGADAVTGHASCIICGNPLLVLPSPLHTGQEVVARERPGYLLASPFLIALLTWATFGTYYIYWFYRLRRFVDETMEIPPRPLLTTLALAVPLLNVAIFFKTMTQAQYAARRCGEDVKRPLWLWGLLFFVLYILGRIPALEEFLPAQFVFVPVVVCHIHILRAYLRRHPEEHVRLRPSAREWAILCVGGLSKCGVIYILATTPLPSFRLYHALSYAFLVAAFLLIATLQKRALRLDPSR